MLNKIIYVVSTLAIFMSSPCFSINHYVFDLEEKIPDFDSASGPLYINEVKVKYATGTPSPDLRAITHWLAQRHPGCSETLKEVISKVETRYPMLLKDERDKEIAYFLSNNLGHVSAVQLYVNAASLALRNTIDPAEQQEIKNIKKYMGITGSSYTLDAILAAIIYNTPLVELQSFIYYNKPMEASPMLTGSFKHMNAGYNLDNARYWVNWGCLGLCPLHYYDAQGRMLK